MAKKQSFGDKTEGKDKNLKKTIKLIRSSVSEKKGSIRFTEDFIQVSDKDSIENAIKKFVESK